MITEALNEENVAEVCEIERECIETPWGLNGLKDEIENEAAFYVCIREGDEIAGYGGIRLNSGMADITNIAVKPRYRRRGIGKIIVKTLVLKAKEKDIYDIALEVNENNEAALKLYEKCGFIRVGIRKKYYNNKDNAIIMKYDEMRND